MAKMSQAKKAVLRFIKVAIDEQMEIVIDGNCTQARNFVQNMRTELARLRDMVRQQNRSPQLWKMLVVSISPEEQTEGEVTKSKIVLQKTNRGNSLTTVDPAIVDAINRMGE